MRGHDWTLYALRALVVVLAVLALILAMVDYSTSP